MSEKRIKLMKISEKVVNLENNWGKTFKILKMSGKIFDFEKL